MTTDQAELTTPRSAALDEAHIGDIRGAFGTIRQHDTAARQSWKAWLLTLLAIVGPGIIVMVGDNDAGGVSTYSQAGQNYGTSLLWTLLLLIPVLIVNQEMVVRLGAVTRVGHARLIFERFGKFWGWFSVGDLYLLNFLTIVTEFIGVRFALGYFGVPDYISVPSAAAVLIVMTATGSFRRWERFMMLFIVVNALVIPLAILSHPTAAPILHGLFVPGIAGGVTSSAVLLIIAIVGTTVAPWQLFFQQSNVIDKRITTRWIQYERLDTIIGSFVTVGGAMAIVIATAFAFKGTAFAGHYTNAEAVAHELRFTVGHLSGTIFAIVLLDASIIGAAAVTLATSYAVGDTFNIKHSLHRSLGEAKGFYASYAGLIALAAAIVLIPHAPLGVITLAVQALAGILLPSATVFLLLLCNDRDVLGPWVNPGWLNALGSLIVGALLILSLILVVTTLIPTVNVTGMLVGFAIVLLVGLGVMGLLTLPGRRARAFVAAPVDRQTWSMPALAELSRPVPSRGRLIGMWALRGYLVLAALLLVAKAILLALGHH